jgi:hypothetical protein
MQCVKFVPDVSGCFADICGFVTVTYYQDRPPQIDEEARKRSTSQKILRAYSMRKSDGARSRSTSPMARLSTGSSKTIRHHSSSGWVQPTMRFGFAVRLDPGNPP